MILLNLMPLWDWVNEVVVVSKNQMPWSYGTLETMDFKILPLSRQTWRLNSARAAPVKKKKVTKQSPKTTLIYKCHPQNYANPTYPIGSRVSKAPAGPPPPPDLGVWATPFRAHLVEGAPPPTHPNLPTTNLSPKQNPLNFDRRISKYIIRLPNLI